MDKKGLSEQEVLKQKKNEENTKLKYITPILLEKWEGEDKIVMEYCFTDGRINVSVDDVVTREKGKKVDYLLLHKTNIPLAVVEAKGIEHSAEEGYQQAIEYAHLLDVPFAYTTNGKVLIERDMITGKNRRLKMCDFPTRDELWERYKLEKGLTDDVEKTYLYPYYSSSSNARSPRYYQRIAINRTIEAISSGKNRILLVMATGTGKTYTAFQIIHRFWSTRKAKKILFLADRNILVDQTMKNDFKPFEKVMVKLDGKNIKTSHEVYLSLYQQLKSADKNNYKQFTRDFFDLIVVDECHRGSASEDSSWHEILNYFTSAIQIGLTATPKETEDTSNIAYFGDPVYTYSLKQGIEDGFLAPYRVISVELDIDKDGYKVPENTFDLQGNDISGKVYEQKDFDRNIIVDERRETVAKRIAEFIRNSGNPYMKTIIFCEKIEHAEAMQRLLENEMSDMVSKYWNYIVKITGDDEVGKAQLNNFIKPSNKVPCIAITSKLMGTGVDSQTCELIVLDRTIGSMTEFKQIVGRGTRIREEYQYEGEEEIYTKKFFTVLDFRKNYLKFSDPDFDGEPVSVIVDPGGGFPPGNSGGNTGGGNTGGNTGGGNTGGDTGGTGPRPPRVIVHLNGVDVEIIDEIVQFLDENGNLIKENLESCVKNNIVSQFPTLEEFKKVWLESSDKTGLAEGLLLSSKYINRCSVELGDVDLFDIVIHVGYNESVKSKEERANLAREKLIPLLEKDSLKDLVEQLLQTYELTDFDTIKDTKVFNLPQFVHEGWSTVKVMRLIGGKKEHTKLLNDIQSLIYEGDL